MKISGKKKSDKLPMRVFDCFNCWPQETYWSRLDGPHYCQICKSELVERKEDDNGKGR